MVNEKRLIDANALFKAIKSFNWFGGYPPNTLKLMFDYLRIIIKKQPTVDAIPVTEIEAYLQSKLDEWNALGDRKWEAANVWGYNFIMACFDDLEKRCEDGKVD